MKPLTTSRPIFPVSSMKCTTAGACIQRWATSAPTRSKINTPDPGSKPLLDLVRRRGRTPHAFVRAPFDQYVREDSSFWNASGLSVKLAGEGISVQMESLRALLLGGVAFDTPHDAKEPPAKPDQTFTLYANFEAAKTAGFTRRLHVLSYFPGSVAGLSAGADVTLYGLKIGEVTDVDLTYDKETDRIVAPVHYQIDAGRIAGISAVEGLPPGTIASEFVKRGLRATLPAPS